jgi:hypothetical protein
MLGTFIEKCLEIGCGIKITREFDSDFAAVAIRLYYRAE